MFFCYIMLFLLFKARSSDKTSEALRLYPLLQRNQQWPLLLFRGLLGLGRQLPQVAQVELLFGFCCCGLDELEHPLFNEVKSCEI